jgi:H+/gluconate symporter-like permease
VLDIAMSLEQELTQRAATCGRQYRFNSWLATAILAVAVGSSAVTTISVAAELLPKVTTAVIAALPAVCVGALNTFRFQERSEWWSEKSVEIDGFLQALRYQHKDETTVSWELMEFQRRHNQKYPGLGKPPA